MVAAVDWSASAAVAAAVAVAHRHSRFGHACSGACPGWWLPYIWVTVLPLQGAHNKKQLCQHLVTVVGCKSMRCSSQLQRWPRTPKGQ
jgi:hypothetical protein